MGNIDQQLQFSSVQSLSHVWLFATPWAAARQASLSITNSWNLLKPIPLSQWCLPAISSSVVPFSSRLQSFPASESFPMSRLFASSGQSIGASASASVLPMNIQCWFPLRLTGNPNSLRIESPRDSQQASPTPRFKSISSLTLILLYVPILSIIIETNLLFISIICI